MILKEFVKHKVIRMERKEVSLKMGELVTMFEGLEAGNRMNK
jgi:hypothetical protein